MKITLRSVLVLLAAQFSYFGRVVFAQNASRQTISDSDNFSERLAAIEKTVEEKRLGYGIPGLALAIVKDNRVIYSQGFGIRDLERNLPVTPETMFNIGSATKAFTAMATVMSADDSSLSLDDSADTIKIKNA